MAKKQRVYRKDNIVGVEYPSLSKRVEVDITALDDNIQFLGLAHGIGQKLGDAASGKTPAEKFEMASRIVEALKAGEWELTATFDDTGLVAEAVARIKNIDADEVKAVLEDLDEEQRVEKIKSWRSNAKVKAEIAKIRAERADAAAQDAEDDIEL